MYYHFFENTILIVGRRFKIQFLFLKSYVIHYNNAVAVICAYSVFFSFILYNIYYFRFSNRWYK